MGTVSWVTAPGVDGACQPPVPGKVKAGHAPHQIGVFGGDEQGEPVPVFELGVVSCDELNDAEQPRTPRAITISSAPRIAHRYWRASGGVNQPFRRENDATAAVWILRVSSIAAPSLFKVNPLEMLPVVGLARYAARHGDRNSNPARRRHEHVLRVGGLRLKVTMEPSSLPTWLAVPT